MDPKSPFDVRDVLWRLRQHLWVGLLSVTVALCAAWIYLTITPSTYSSYVTVSLADQTRLSPALEPLVSAERDRQTRSSQIAELDSRIHSRPFLQAVAERMGLNKNPELLLEGSQAAATIGISTEDYALRKSMSFLRKRIQVSPTPRTSYLQISALGTTPRFSLRLATAITQALVEESRSVALERMRARGRFSDDQVQVQEDMLHRSEGALRRFQETMLGAGDAGNPVTDGNLETARGIVRSTEGEMMGEIRTRLRADLAQWERHSPAAGGPPQLGSATTRSLEARLREAEVSSGIALLGGSGTPEARTAEEKTGAIRQDLLVAYEALARGEPKLDSGALQDLAAEVALYRTQLRSLQARRDRIAGYIDKHLRGIARSPGDQMELDRLRTEVENSRNLLLTLKKEATSSKLTEAMETNDLGSRVEIIEPPQMPLLPVSPNPPKSLAGALAAGIVLGLGLMLAAERLPGALRTVEEAERELGAKVIGTIPRVAGWPRPGTFLQNYWAHLSLLVVVVSTVIFIVVHHVTQAPRPGSPAAATHVR